MKNSWDKDSVNKLLKYLKKGFSYKEIAEKLGKTSNSVRLKVNRLGCKSSDFKKESDKFCHNCNKLYKGDKGSKFCSRSCSVSYNNKLRVHSVLTKAKIANSLKGNKNNPLSVKRFCENCETIISDNNKSGKCRKCLDKDPEYRLRFKQAMKGKVGGYRVKGGNPQHKGSYYKDVWMDSSWELLLAKRLDELNIVWERGSKVWLPWVDDSSIGHKYYPDFFLPEFNKYVEIKGYWLEKTRVKMNKVLEQNTVEIIILESVESIKSFTLMKKQYDMH